MTNRIHSLGRMEPAPAETLFLALDGGGSKCDCLIAREDGEILAWGSQRRPGTSGRSSQVVGESVRAALASLPVAARRFNFCLTGVSALPFSAPGGEASLAPCGRVRESCPGPLGAASVSHVDLIAEHTAALALHGLDEGVVALAGTGAFVHVEMPSRGTVLHVDGYGPVLGDCGSAHQVGLAAFRAAAAADWSPRRATSLRAAVFKALGLASVEAAVRLSLRHLDRSLLASLAPVVEAEAIQGDARARAILHEAADALAETIRDALAASRLFDVEAALVGTGGLATRCPLYWDRVRERVHAMAPGLRPRVESRPAVLGTLAVGMALRQGIPGGGITTLADRLIRSYDARFGLERNRKADYVPG